MAMKQILEAKPYKLKIHTLQAWVEKPYMLLVLVLQVTRLLDFYDSCYVESEVFIAWSIVLFYIWLTKTHLI